MSDVTALVGYATALFKQGRHGEAEQLYKQALAQVSEDSPRSAVINAALGGIYIHLGQNENAETYFRQALKQLPNGDQETDAVLIGIGAACMNQGRLEEAEEYYRRALTTARSSASKIDPSPLSQLASSSRESSNNQLSPQLLHALPPNVRADVLESQVCLQSGCWNAFAAMARRTVHSVCAALGSSQGDLYEQIEKLKALHRFTDDEAVRAHEIRTLGRNATHPEWEVVTEKTATVCWGLLIWLLRHLYEKPDPPDWKQNTQRRY